VDLAMNILAKYVEPQLTTFDVKTRQIGEAAAKLLLRTDH